jgi:hypothetical protein
MVKRERRLALRMAVNGQTYVNLDRDNGGIILNISEGGLCFQSTAPIEQTENIRFWFSYRRVDPDAGLAWQADVQSRGISRYIEAGSELAWVDDTRKRGGLRFTNISPAAREQIREWMCQPAMVGGNRNFLPSLPAMKRHSNALQKASAKLANVFLQRLQRRRLPNGFSSGLLTGIVVSALITVAVVVLSHPRAVGDSLVKMGQQLGGGKVVSEETLVGAVVSAAEPAVKSTVLSREPKQPEAQPVSQEQPAFSAATSSHPFDEKSLSAATPVVKLFQAADLYAATGPSRSAFKFTASDPPRVKSALIRPAIPAIESATPDPGTKMFGSITTETASVARPTVYISASSIESGLMVSQKYLEVGKFKEKLLADRATEQLSRKGFATEVVARNRLFGKSYQVLAGPYRDDREAESAHKDLASLGFTPRSYERGKRDLYLPNGLKIGSTGVPVGACTITWESYIPDAIVKFQDEKGRAVTFEAKWMKQGVKYVHSAIAYSTNRDGSRTLLELRFSNMDQALVFGSIRD